MNVLSILLGVMIFVAVASTAAAQTPNVEISINQFPISIGRGQTESLYLTGAVHGAHFFGDINLSPPSENACIIFVNGQNTFVSLPGNNANIPIANVSVRVPQSMSTGTFTCILNYVAVVRGPNGVLTDTRVDKRNMVTFRYTVKN